MAQSPKTLEPLNPERLLIPFFSQKGQALLRAGELLPEEGPMGTNRSLALAMQLNFEPFGFTFDLALLRSLSHLPKARLAELHSSLSQSLASLSGGHRRFAPMYPNFPEQVLSATEEELLANALIHYQGGFLSPNLPKAKTPERGRRALAQMLKPKILSGIDTRVAMMSLERVLSSPNGMTPAARETLPSLLLFCKNEPSFAASISPQRIASRETRASLCAALLSQPDAFDESLARELLDVPVDSLRLACAMAGGDPSLATPTRLGKLPRKSRRMMLSSMEAYAASKGIDRLTEELATRREVFLRLFERLHVREHERKFPLCAQSAKALRDRQLPASFESRVDAFLGQKDLDGLLKLAGARPGMFLRSLSRYLLAFPKPDENARILDALESVADRCATSALLQLYSRLGAPSGPPRVFLPKGPMGKIFIDETQSAPMPNAESALRAMILCEEALKKRFAKLPPLGSCSISDDLRDIPIPFSSRSAAKSLATLDRGAKLPFNGKIARYFLWWNETWAKEEEGKPAPGRVDIDLSCAILDQNFKHIGKCAFTHLRDQGATHSGDITSAPNGACEFIDIDFSSLPEEAAYCAFVINSFSGQKYKDLPECFAGWMPRDGAIDEAIFDARTVEQKVDLASESVCVFVSLLDVKNRKMVWVDASLRSSDAWGAIERQTETISQLSKAILHLPKPSLHDLFRLHAQARGRIALPNETPDTRFALKDSAVSPFGRELISASFLQGPSEEPESAAQPSGRRHAP